jgi:hypothetical protein
MAESGARGRRGSAKGGQERPGGVGRRRGALRGLRYPATCTVCHASLGKGDLAVWNAERRTATCAACIEGVTVDGAEAGTAGASADREANRRRRLQRARAGASDDGGRLWALVARVGRSTPDAGAPWGAGAAGERQLGKLLDRLASDGTITVLHDRALPGSPANLDHLVIAASGVWVVDAKNYRGRVEVVDVGSVFRPELRLMVDGRDRTAKLVRGGRWQADHVRDALDPTYREVPVYRALCFVDAKLRLGSKARTIEGVLVSWEKDIVRRLQEPGSLDQRWRNAIQRHLATRFRPAAGATG